MAILGLTIGVVITLLIFAVFGPVAGIGWIVFGCIIGHLTRA